MLKLEYVQAFAAIAEGGSLTVAARRLGLSKSVISDRLTELERSLGSKLIHRFMISAEASPHATDS